MGIRSRCMGLVLWLGSTAVVARADTKQYFDTAGRGTAYAHSDARTDPSVQGDNPPEFADFVSPNPVDSCNSKSVRRMSDGTRTFLRLAHDTVPTTPRRNCNTVTFNCVEPRTTGRVKIDFDFRVTNGIDEAPADGFSISLLRVADDLALDASIAMDEELRPDNAEDPAIAGSLGFGFRFYTPADEPVENVKVFWDGARIQDRFPLLPNQSMVNTGWIHASIRVDFAEQLVNLLLTRGDMTEVLRIDNLVIPGLAPYASRIHLAGRSGGLTADIDIDDLTVEFPPGNPARVGSWSPVFPLEAVPIHAALLLGGQVLYWGRHDYGDHEPFLWDGTESTPTANMPTMPGTTQSYDLFCAGHTFAADGSLFVAGGHIVDEFGEPWASRFDPFSRSWNSLAAMRAGRWYPTTTTLPNGDVAVVSGSINTFVGPNQIPEVYDVRAGNWRELTGAQRPLPFYPFMFTTPQGLFAAGPMVETGFLDVAAPGRWIPVDKTIAGRSEGAAIGRNYGSAVLDGMGRILVIGGTVQSGGGDETQRSTEWIDVSHTMKPSWKPGPSMIFARRMHVATLLPDGSVLVTGGTSGDAFNRADGAVLNPELLASVEDRWQPMACGTEARVYHSVALLLPDARVLVAGGGHPAEQEICDNPPCAALDHPTGEIFSPPYLHRGGPPQLAAPTIVEGPGVKVGVDGIARVRYGATITYTVAEPSRVAVVSWLRPAAVTHAFNQDQRIVWLDAGPDGIGSQAIAPSDHAVAPPGPYMMFLLDTNGVPSHAAWVRTNLPPDAADDAFEIVANQSIPDIVGRITANDIDVEGDPTTVTIVQPPSQGKIVNGAYTPSVDASGDDSFEYALSDGLDTSRPATVKIQIAPVSRPPDDGVPAQAPDAGPDAGSPQGSPGPCGCGSLGSQPLGSLLLAAAAAATVLRRRRPR
jgi:hypothetical protein